MIDIDHAIEATAGHGLGFHGYGDTDSDVNLHELRRVIVWLRFEVSGWTKPHDSYVLKHQCEKALKSYVGNGEIIAAALYIGLPVKRVPGTPNATIGTKK